MPTMFPTHVPPSRRHLHSGAILSKRLKHQGRRSTQRTPHYGSGAHPAAVSGTLMDPPKVHGRMRDRFHPTPSNCCPHVHLPTSPVQRGYVHTFQAREDKHHSRGGFKLGVSDDRSETNSRWPPVAARAGKFGCNETVGLQPPPLLIFPGLLRCRHG